MEHRSGAFLVNVDHLLQVKRMSRSDLARKVDLPVSTINSWYSRETSPRLDDAVRVAKALRMSLDTLAGEEERKVVLEIACIASSLSDGSLGLLHDLARSVSSYDQKQRRKGQ